jgi:hypothetical protein
MVPERLSHLQHHILAWLIAEVQRTDGTTAASHQDLVHALTTTRGTSAPAWPTSKPRV